jgi:hypothetical protein
MPNRTTLGPREVAVVGIAGLLSIMTGAAVAYLARRFPAQATAFAGAPIETLETGAGALLIGGLALATSGMPVFL